MTIYRIAAKSTAKTDDFESVKKTAQKQDFRQMPVNKPQSQGKAELIAGLSKLESALMNSDALNLAGKAETKPFSASDALSELKGFKASELSASTGNLKLNLSKEDMAELFNL